MSTLLFEFLLTSLLIELTPGPNMAYLAAMALAQGRRVGLAAVGGVAIGLLTIGLLATFGLTAVLDAIPYSYQVLRYAGALFLLFLAYEGWRGTENGEVEPMALRASFGRSFLANILNPKAALFYITVLPLFIEPGKPDILRQNVVLVLLYVAVATFVHAAIVLFADALRPYLIAGNRERFVRRVLAVGLALVAIWFFWSTRA